MYLLSSDESDSLDDEYDNDESDFGSSGTCYFPLRFGNLIGHDSGLGSDVFVPTVVESKCDVFAFVVFLPIGVESKGG